MKALVTGFEAWAGHMNPGGMIAKELNGRNLDGLDVVSVELPEDFYAIPGLARKYFDELHPNIIISIGWDYTRTVRVEKVALNIMSSVFGDKVVPDNRGNTPKDQPVIKGAPLARRSTLPVDRIVSAIGRSEIPVAGSFYAGTHCCNTTMFSFLQATRSHPETVSGHIHIPPVPEMLKEGDVNLRSQGKEIFTLPISTEKRAVEIALKTCKEYLESRSL
ncbi:MAG: hypothetical protein JRN68_08795 [Nitrososphaerota archaeon]|jgi:pyroglutamyl-peptidase|nr:hypothetical protein [Nitrososphaerota archaeon]